MSRPIHFIHDSLPIFTLATNQLAETVQARAQDQAQIQDLAQWVVLGVTVTLCLLAWGM